MEQTALPRVDRTIPSTHRFLLLIAGVALLGWSLRALWRGPWQWDFFALASLFMAAGAAGSAMLLIAAALAAESHERWQYVPKALVIHRRKWGRDGEIRLTAANVSSIRLLHLRDVEAPDRWRVVVRPHEGATSRWTGPDRGSGFETDDLASLEFAEAARRALLAHLGMAERR